MNGQLSPTWRFLNDCTPQQGALNMALDEVLLEGAGHNGPTLRLYAWSPACLSLGYGQTWGDVDLEALAARNWGLVRRATGGKAILHTDELTYSLTLPSDHPLASGGVVESYRRISRALLAACAHLGVPAVESEMQGGTTTSEDGVCFRAPSHYEITVGSRKLVGSAQVRRRAGVLQHGTLPLTGDLGRICEVLAYADEPTRADARARLSQRALTLEEAAGRLIGWDEAADAFRIGVEQTFGIALQWSAWTAAEQAHAAQIAQAVYGTDSWTARR